MVEGRRWKKGMEEGKDGSVGRVRKDVRRLDGTRKKESRNLVQVASIQFKRLRSKMTRHNKLVLK